MLKENSTENEVCEVNYIHEDKVLRTKERLASVNVVPLKAIFKILADENRLKIIFALDCENKLCVCDIATIINASTATTSPIIAEKKGNS